LLILMLPGCRRDTAEKPASPPPVEESFTLALEPATAPAQIESGQAQLTSSPRGVVLSWIERKDPSATLRFSERASGAWSPPKTVASNDNWFISDADVPSVLRMSDGTLVAATNPSIDVRIEAYELRLAYSRDDGKTWSAPISPHHDGTRTQHGFGSLFEMPGPALGLVWLDGRDQDANTTDPQGGSMRLYFTSFDKGWKQSPETVIDARTCECCQTAAVMTDDGPLTAFRDRTEQEVRDIQVARLEGSKWTPAAPVHRDNWTIDACPVNGPALSAKGRSAAIAWFSAAGGDGHAYAAFSADAGRTWSAPIRLDDDTSLGNVDIELLDDGSAIASWVEFTSERAQFRVRLIKPTGGRSKPIVVAGSGEARVSGYPRIARQGRELVLAWTESGGTGPASQRVKVAVGTLK
jgi:hypothetical protein